MDGPRATVHGTHRRTRAPPDRAVVVARSPAIEELFEESELLFFEAGDQEDLARTLEIALADPARREECVRRGGAVAERHRWDRERLIYLDVVESLAGSAR